MSRLFLFILLALVSFGSSSGESIPPKHEMRSAWLATVWGLDWPSTTGTSRSVIAKQKKELDTLLDNLKSAGLNAVSFQVRSMSDAMYRSSLEPWSRFLTGERGAKPDDDSWDPLAYCVEQCHRRGMECHAWVNPFRLATGATLPSTSFDKKARNAGWVITYKKRGKRGSVTASSILDPGNRSVRGHIVDVCREIVANYDVDGLMFDDYFYPEGLPLGEGYDFAEWKSSGSSLSQADWRRDNVRQLVRDVYEMIQETKPFVKFGISPAGVGGGNGVSSTRYGLPACYSGSDWVYDGIYCDPLSWLADGSVDYISPQIYWTRDNKSNPYEPIARWWADVAQHFGRHFYSSLSPAKFNTSESEVDPCAEGGAQIDLNRSLTSSNGTGTVFYSAKHVGGNEAKLLNNYLSDNHFRQKALTPAMAWKIADDPGLLEGLTLNGSQLQWTGIEGMRYVAYAIPDNVNASDAKAGTESGFSPTYMLDVAYTPTIQIPDDKLTGYWYAVAPYDRYSNEWTPTCLNMPQVFSNSSAELDDAGAMREEVVQMSSIEEAISKDFTIEVAEAEEVVEQLIAPPTPLRVDLGRTARSARMFDMTGSLVATVRQTNHIDAPAPGEYVVRIVDETGGSSTIKIVVE